MASFKTKLIHAFDVFKDYPWLAIVLGVLFLIYAVAKMRERQSSAGSWVVIIIAVILFMYGLSGVTGLSLYMSF